MCIKTSLKTLAFILLGLLLGAVISSLRYNQPIIEVGWHSCITAPCHFTLGAMLLGEAIIVFIIAILQFIPPTKILAAKTIEITAKGLAFVGIFMVFRGIYELFIIWYSGVFYEQFAFYARGGLLASIVALTVGIILSQTLWIKKIRRNPFWIAIMALVIIIANFI